MTTETYALVYVHGVFHRKLKLSLFPGGLDYKGVREIMKACIDKLLLLPASVGVIQVKVYL